MAPGYVNILIHYRGAFYRKDHYLSIIVEVESAFSEILRRI